MSDYLFVGPEIKSSINAIQHHFLSFNKKLTIEGNKIHSINCRKKFDLPEYSNIYIDAHGIIEDDYYSMNLCSHTSKPSIAFKSFLRPVNVKLHSCHSGAAIKNIDYLPVYSTLTTFVKDDLIGTGAITGFMIEMAAPLYDNPFIEFASLMMYSTQVSKFAIKTGEKSELFESSIMELQNYSSDTIDLWRFSELEKFIRFLGRITLEGNQLSKLEEAITMLSNKNWIQYFDLPLHRNLLVYDYLSLNELDKVKSLLKEELDVNFISSDGDAALHLATLGQYTEIIKELIDVGADVNLVHKNNGITPFFIASQEGNLEIANILIKAGANINLARYDGTTPLFIAAQNGHVNIVKLLVELEIDLNFSGDGVTPLCKAAYKGHLEISKILIDAGADVNLHRYDGVGPLFVAAQGGYFEIAKILINSGANLNLAFNKTTPLEIAAQKGYLDVFNLLVASDAENINGYIAEDMPNFEHDPLAYILTVSNTAQDALKTLSHLNPSMIPQEQQSLIKCLKLLDLDSHYSSLLDEVVECSKTMHSYEYGEQSSDMCGLTPNESMDIESSAIYY